MHQFFKETAEAERYEAGTDSGRTHCTTPEKPLQLTTQTTESRGVAGSITSLCRKDVTDVYRDHFNSGDIVQAKIVSYQALSGSSRVCDRWQFSSVG
jgi:exosome complex RNA-binding protein Csl4